MDELLEERAQELPALPRPAQATRWTTGAQCDATADMAGRPMSSEPTVRDVRAIYARRSPSVAPRDARRVSRRADCRVSACRSQPSR